MDHRADVLKAMGRSLRILITAGPTREPIDPVRFIGNRSSGRMGAALARAAVAGGHETTLIVGPVSIPMPGGVRQLSVQTTAQMLGAVLREFPGHDLLLMAAAPADFRPVHVSEQKIARAGRLVIECEPTEDIVATASRTRRPDQRIIAFSLETTPDMDRVRDKMARKDVDVMVYNPASTMDSATVDAVLLYRDGRSESLPCRTKDQFADNLLSRAVALFA